MKLYKEDTMIIKGKKIPVKDYTIQPQLLPGDIQNFLVFHLDRLASKTRLNLKNNKRMSYNKQRLEDIKFIKKWVVEKCEEDYQKQKGVDP